MTIDRRMLLCGAPAIVAASSLMPVKMFDYNAPWVEYDFFLERESNDCLVGVRARARLDEVRRRIKRGTYKIIGREKRIVEAYFKFVDGPWDSPILKNGTIVKTEFAPKGPFSRGFSADIHVGGWSAEQEKGLVLKPALQGLV